MSIGPSISSKYLRWRKLLIFAPLTLSLIMVSAPDIWGQGDAAKQDAPEMKFELLDATTGSGSKAKGVAEPMELKIEVVGENEPSPVLSEAIEEELDAAGLSPEELKAAKKQAEVFAYMDQWRKRVLAAYNFDIMSLADPFMPIKEVRGTPDENLLDEADEAPASPLLRLELNQLKLVAITILSSGSGNAWASFEDGAGASYILRKGDRIGRNNGRIVNIAPNVVTVEERGRRGNEEPQITEIKLNVTSTEGLTKSGGE